MKSTIRLVLAFCMLFFSSLAVAQQTGPSIPGATIRVPQCLQFPDSKTYTPCTGVVPVDRATGNALDWTSVFKGSPSDPVYTQPVQNGTPVSQTNPVPTSDTHNATSTAPLGSAAPATARLMGGKDANGNIQALSITNTGGLNVTCSNCSGGGSGTSTGGGGVAGNLDPNNGALYTEESIRRMHWVESQTPLDAGVLFTGVTRDDGSPTNGGSSKWNVFSCFAWANQNATLMIQSSVDGVTWLTLQSRTWTAGSSLFLTQPLFTKYSRCQVMNGSTANTGFILSSALGVN